MSDPFESLSDELRDALTTRGHPDWLDPMLATGNSAVAAIDRLKEAGAQDIRFLCLLAAPEGVKAVAASHPDVRIFTAAVDDRLDENGYIVPGMGDAGDRMYGTK